MTAATAHIGPQDDRIEQLFQRQRAKRAAVRATTAAQRIEKLQRLRSAILERQDAIRAALHQDFRKSAAEVDLTEIYPALVELKRAVKSLRGWMKPHRVTTPLALFGTTSAVHYEPRGVVLIIGAWNYPLHLVIVPLIAAIAAGNCAIVKPSELTPATSALATELLGAVFSEDEVAVVEGGPEATQQLLALPFDHFFFTGSAKVGRIVAEAAARHLASTTLELGGKSPAVVDDSADLAQAAKRIVWGKFVNGGQTCIAPDYVLVSQGRKQELIEHLSNAIADQYGDNEQARRSSPDLCRVINQRNYDRLKRMLDDTVSAGARIELGGTTEPSERYIAPTVLSDVSPEAPIMADEIFGPILPVLTYKSLDEVVPFISAREKPLALYVFGSDRQRVDAIIEGTSAGGTCVNNAMIHFGNTYLPFGGVGPSGLGNYHGFYGFKAFSHERAVLRQGPFATIKMIYPPYTPRVKRVINWMFKLFT
ncbi:MAG: aldehyde dehydrogenase family protein [Kofleriaceae bacterium]